MFPRTVPADARSQIWLWGVLAFALLVRAVHLWGQARNNPFFGDPIMDERMHHEWAMAIASGEGLGAVPYFRAPLYYLLLALLYLVAGPLMWLARVMGIVIGAGSCYLVGRIGTTLAGLRVGVAAGLAAALYWPLIYFDGLLLTVGLEIFLNLLMLWLLLAAVRAEYAGNKHAMWFFVAAGVAWGLSALGRPNVLAFAPGILIWLWIALRSKHASRAVARRGVVLRFLIVCIGAAIAVAPVTIRNRVVGGEWVLIASNGGVNFYIGNNPLADGIAAVVPGTRADWKGGYEDTHRIPQEKLGRQLSEGDVSSYWFRKGVDWIVSNPGAWLRLTLHKLGLFWVPYEIPNNQPITFFAELSELSALYWLGFPPVAVLGVAGLCTLGGRGRGWLLIVLFGVVYMGTVVLFFCPARYRLPVVPVLILLAVGGLVRLPTLWRQRRLVALGGYAVVIAAGSVFMVARQPGSEWKQAELGRAYHNLGAHYARVAEVDPTQVDRALDYLRRAAELRPEDPYLQQSLGTWLTRFGRDDEAGAHFAQATDLLPSYPDARQAYGDWLFARGRFAEAAREYQAALAARPDLIEVRYQLGRTLARGGQMEAAVAQFRLVLEAEPAAVPVLFDLAAALRRLDDPSGAASYYRRILELAPGYAEAASRLARLHFEAGAYAEALAVLRAALAETPDDVMLLSDLAGLLMSIPDPALRDSAEAVRLGERALALAPTPGIVLLDTLANAYAAQGRYDDAIGLTREALARAQRAGDEATAKTLATWLEYYEKGKRQAQRPEE